MSLTEISVRVAVVTALALGALVAVGWRRPASRYSRAPRSEQALTPTQSGNVDDAVANSNPSRHAELVHRSTTRKFVDIVGLGSIATFAGIIVAMVVSTVIAWLVTTLLNRL